MVVSNIDFLHRGTIFWGGGVPKNFEKSVRKSTTNRYGMKIFQATNDTNNRDGFIISQVIQICHSKVI